MSVRGYRSRARDDASTRRSIGDLAVMVRVGAIVVAIPAERVVRIVLAEEVQPAPSVGTTPHVRIGDRVLPGWELATLLGSPEPVRAWLVLAVRDGGDAAHIAIGSGPCVAIAGHDAPIALPPGVVTAPRASIVGVFSTDAALRARGGGALGVRIDPLALIGSVRLAAAMRGAG